MPTNLGVYTLPVKAHLPAGRVHHLGMPNPVGQAQLKRMSGVDQRYIGRILAAESSITVDTLEKIAKAFDLQAWQLLVPGLDPGNPPVNHITDAERRLYERLRQTVMEVVEERKVYK